MGKVKLTITIELNEDIWDLNEYTEVEWLKEKVLAKESLFLHSNEIGDTLGEVVKVEQIQVFSKKQNK